MMWFLPLVVSEFILGKSCWDDLDDGISAGDSTDSVWNMNTKIFHSEKYVFSRQKRVPFFK